MVGILNEISEEMTLDDGGGDVWELRNRIRQAIAQGFIKQIPVKMPNRFLPTEEWYQDTDTGEIYSFLTPEERIRGHWKRVDVDNYLKPNQSVQ